MLSDTNPNRTTRTLSRNISRLIKDNDYQSVPLQNIDQSKTQNPMLDKLIDV
jgi:hypothetical protein